MSATSNWSMLAAGAVCLFTISASIGHTAAGTRANLSCWTVAMA